jgi:hypothetical protein
MQMCAVTKCSERWCLGLECCAQDLKSRSRLLDAACGDSSAYRVATSLEYGECADNSYDLLLTLRARCGQSADVSA